jgi:type II secretory pathway pseudopilin PulG
VEIMQNRRPILNRKPTEDGFMLLVAIFMLALLLLALSIAVPQITKEIQRDREVETKHRGLQYRRAIQLYYRKFGAYPPSIDVLVKTNNIRFLRKKYIDPMTGKDDWKPIALGQNKAPLAMGFFGQPLTGAGGGANPFAGAGSSGGMGLNGTSGSSFGGSSNTGGSTFGSSGSSGSSMFGSSNSGSTFGTDANTNSGTGATGSTDNSGNTIGSGSTTGNGRTSTGTGTGTGSTTSTFGGPASGQTFGGSIVGVSPVGTKQSILLYKKKNHYNEWEFTYSPLSELKAIGGGASGLPGQPAGVNQNGSSGFGGSTFGGSSGSGFGGSSFGGSSGSGFGGSNFGGAGNGTGTNQSPAPQQNQQF